MTLQLVISRLQHNLSVFATILTDPNAEEFRQHCLRWSDINRKTPAAIIVAGEESDVLKIVKEAVENHVPFVPCSGGHSVWSTIGKEGFILDLRRLDKVSINAESRRVTVQSGALVGKVNKDAWEHGLCLPLGTANSAGVIPMAIGGGLNCLSGRIGSASDNIVSARVVTADGHLLDVSSTSHADLFYGLRGAGQCFGVVTEITLQAHPTSILGTADATVWTGVIIFPVSKAERVFEVLSRLTQDTEAPAMGSCIITSPPPDFSTSLIVIPVFFGDAHAATMFYQPLLQLDPVSTCASIPYPRVNDAGEAFGVKGGFKRFAGTGIRTLDPKVWLQVVARYEKLKREIPDASRSGYAVEWVQRAGPEVPETAFAHRERTMWAEFLSWYSDAAFDNAVFAAESEAIAITRQDQKPSDYITYQNWTRDVPIEQLYTGKDRLPKLRALKQQWDPAGVFTRLFLD